MPISIIDVIAGARPNFVKVAALFAVAQDFPNQELRLIHTGQHYDYSMSGVFLDELGLPEPVSHLGVGSGSHASQTAAIMKGYEGCVNTSRPDLCLVVGDVNSTIACALVAAKERVLVAHVEAGLRSFDRTMPEEINRILTDSISDLMFVSEPSGIANLQREGHPPEGVHLVGNTMIDTLIRMRPRIERLHTHNAFALNPNDYAYLTLHRPANVDENEALAQICEQLVWLASRIAVLFPVHPRTRKRLEATGLIEQLARAKGVHLVEPVGYLESLSLALHAKFVVTDSGGIQEESTALKVPCLTLRENTERPITVDAGTNTIIGKDWELLRTNVDRILNNQYKQGASMIPYWDGLAGKRILDIISEKMIALGNTQPPI